MGKATVSFTLNGRQRTFEVPAGRRLLDLLRDDAGLTGTKEGCGAGECGACTVLLNGLPVPSCLVLAVSCEGLEVVTIEGLGGDRPLHPLQRAMVEHGGVQCGFCTPGIVTTGAALLERGVADPLEQSRHLAGNLCRCTGYSKIFEALQAAARERSDG